MSRRRNTSMLSFLFVCLSVCVCRGELPSPNSTTDTQLAAYLTRMWDGYDKALRFRESQMPPMDVENDVIVFRDAKFEDHIIEFDAILVLFYSPNIQTSKDLLPVFEESAKDLIMYEPHISSGKMDCTGEGLKTCRKLRVPRTPWLKLFKQGEFHQDYHLSKNVKSICKFMRNCFEPHIKKLRTEADIQDYISEEEGSVLAFFNKNNKEMKELYKLVAKELSLIGLYFGFVTNKKLREQYKEYDGKILLVRSALLGSNYEKNIAVYSGELTKVELHQWLIHQKLGLMSFRHEGNSYLFRFPLTVIYFNVIIDEEYAAQATFNTLRIRNSLMRVASNYSKQMNFAISDKEEYKHELRTCGFGTERMSTQEPMVCLMDENENRYKMDMSFNDEAFSEFVEKFLAGRATRFLKSEAAYDNAGVSLKKMVASNMEDVIIKNKKDVLVLFYRQSCPHCQTALVVFAEIAEAMKDENIDVVKMDVSLNEVPPEFKSEYFIREVPMIVFKSQEKSNHAVQFVGTRSYKAILAFIYSQATDGLVGWDWRGRRVEVHTLTDEEQGVVEEPIAESPAQKTEL